MLETGESVDRQATRETFERLMRPVNPMVLGYVVSEFYSWDETDRWRADGIWGKMNSLRFGRIFPGRRIGGFDQIASRNGYLPVLPIEMVRISNIGVICKELCDEEHRRLHHDFCQQIEQKLNWDHLLDTSKMASYPFSDRTLSVYMPLHQGGEKLLAWLDHVWSWADEIVIGNDSSQLTLEDTALLKAWGARVVPCVMNGN